MAVYFVSNLLEAEGHLNFFLKFLMQRKVDSSEYMILDQSSGVQRAYCLANLSLFTIILEVNRGFMVTTCEGILRNFCSACCTEGSAVSARAGILFFKSPAVRVGSLLMLN